VFATYFLPQQKLIFKQRNGAKVIKKYDTATTPHQRAVAHPDVRKRPIITMNAVFKRLKPAALSRQILALTGQLEALAQAKTAPRAFRVSCHSRGSMITLRGRKVPVRWCPLPPCRAEC